MNCSQRLELKNVEIFVIRNSSTRSVASNISHLEYYILRFKMATVNQFLEKNNRIKNLAYGKEKNLEVTYLV